MSDEFDQKLRQAFPANTDAAVVRCLSSAVTLADDARRNIPWLANVIGDDHRGLLRRAAAMWQFRQDCHAGNLPFNAEEIGNTTGSAHLLRITSGQFEAHIVRTESEGAFPKDAPIRQDMSLHNQPDLFRDGKIVPLRELEVERFYAWLAFNADLTGGLTHVCWCMPEPERKRFLSHVNILRLAGVTSVEPHEPPPPDLTKEIKFKREVIEKIMDTSPRKQEKKQ